MSGLNEQENTMNKPLSLLSQTKGVSSYCLDLLLVAFVSFFPRLEVHCRLQVGGCGWNENKLGVQIAWNIAWMYVS
ncbi:hypothetical protein L873DRAFT_1802214 [Choiromyces venosus 120613-1]|uniref:Uncharacterized protein n=1 Tax=Choiromyces venosus 120613-1 TaxID=1336337 RepID=A0A3N4K8K3_9PEZI|nr:hypothetical protein L873DRAFT_1802214 [Choiromyces venosus 120613-1]